MSEQNNTSLIIAVLVGCFAIALSIIFYAINIQGVPASEQVQEVNKVKVEKEYNEKEAMDDDPVLGSMDAPVTLIEFSDYRCGYCRRHFEQTLPLIKEEYIDTGKVKMVFRDAANLGPQSVYLANAASCAQKLQDDEAYYAVHAAIYSGITNEDGLVTVAKNLGMDSETYRACLSNLEQQTEVLLDTKAAKDYGVQGTPGFLVNGELISGAQSFDVFKQFIEAELNK